MVTIEDRELARGTWSVRRYREDDTAALSEICLRTGDSGTDATGLFTDDDLLSDIYLLPYLALEPDFVRVLVNGDRPLGYVVAAPDSIRFAQRYREEWQPGFAQRHPVDSGADARQRETVERGWNPERDVGPDQQLFPAHLHINLMPEAQGHGWGRALLRELLQALEKAGVPGVQLGVGERNLAAQAFYRRLGFAPLPSTPDDVYRLGLATDAYRTW